MYRRNGLIALGLIGIATSAAAIGGFNFGIVGSISGVSGRVENRRGDLRDGELL